MKKKNYDVIIIGAGVTGTALFYVLSKYTDIKNIALIEKYTQIAQVNSTSKNNSQTLHYGDIETNYTLEKAKKIKKAAEMVANYVENLVNGKSLFNKTNKMVLGVGKEEVQKLEKRYKEFKKLFPKLKKINKEEIGKLEPRIVEGRNPNEEILALSTEDGYAIDYGKLSESFVENSFGNSEKKIDVFLNTKIKKINKEDKYIVKTDKNDLNASVVIVAAGSHSLIFAQSLGYGKELGLLPVAGSFYCAPKILNGKVYTLQLKKLPFAAIHGDPDVTNPKETRFGPTAKVLPVLERHKPGTLFDFLRTSAFTIKGILSLAKIISDPILFRYIARNFMYDLPVIGKRLFIKEVRKIVPSIKLNELKFGKGIGGIRPQIVNIKDMKLDMGEAKIIGDDIIFNITPSPGASTCLKNAENDTLKIIEFFEGKFKFNKDKFKKDLKDKL